MSDPPIVSPPNQPRRSLSNQLSPDYHDWVHSSSSPKSSRPSSGTNRFLGAVTGLTNKGRARRENQPSFSGSALEVSESEDDSQERYRTMQESSPAITNDPLPEHADSRPQQQLQINNPDHSHSNEAPGRVSTTDPHTPLINSESTSSQTPVRTKLPSLSKSRVEVPDSSRPAFKMGAPTVVSTPSRQQSPRGSTSAISSTKQHSPSPSKSSSLNAPSSETTALLGPRSPQSRGSEDRWTNEGSRRRAPRYDGNQYPDNVREDDSEDDLDGRDSLRRPSRARSLSPTMESRRGNNRERGRVIFRNSNQNGRGQSAFYGRSRSKTFQYLRRSSIANINLVKEKFLSRRSGYYDDAKEALFKENNGLRVWYHNYTTIDWIHDFVKERVRLRHLRSLRGIRGMLKNRADGLKGWVIVLLTGVITACLAAFIDVSSWWLGDLRMGYCTTSFWWSQYFCCWGLSNGEECTAWVSWSQSFSGDNARLGVSNDTFDWIIYCCFGTLFAWVCVVMVTSDGTVSQQKSHGSTKRRNGITQGTLPRSNSRTSMENIMQASQPKKIAYFGAGSGIPEVKTILGGFVIRGFLGFRTLMIKLIGLPLMVASGLNMGKQGPLVHIACCVGNILCRIFDKYNRNDGKRREILSAASAAGVAVAFGAPIGGVLFSLEEVSYYFPSKTMWRTYFCALISAVVLKMINPYRVGKTVLFQVTYDRDWHLFEAVPFFLISVFGGVYGAVFSQFHMSYSRFRSRTWIGRHPVQEVLAVALITCAIQWLNPWTRVNLLQLLTNLYSECTPTNNLNGMCADEISQIYPIFLLLAEVFLMKVFLNFITFGVKVPGGIFIPTMVAGAVFGRMVGLGMQWLIAKYPDHHVFQVCDSDSMDCVIPGLYAMIGAAACLAGVTRMTVSLVVIMFELTGAMTYSLPIMMAVMMGKFVGDAFSPDAFFNKLIDLNGHPYLDSKKDYNTFGTAADICERSLDVIEVNEVNTVDMLRRKVEDLAASGYSDGGLPIVDHGVLVGYIASNELGHALDLAEQKHPDCVCIFRNRASSNVPATEIVASLDNGLETNTEPSILAEGTPGYIFVESPPNEREVPPYEQRHRPFRMPSRDDDSFTDEDFYDDDMQRPERDSRYADGYYISYKDQERLKPVQKIENKSMGTHYTTETGPRADRHAVDEEGSLHNSDRVRHRFGLYNGRMNSTGTTALLQDPAHTMDFTPFTDQAPLSVSLFSSMDLVMELFIKLGIKYVCVVKAGEHYGMIHKKRLLTFLKENDKKDKGYRSSCF